jgi:hypothetical protein
LVLVTQLRSLLPGWLGLPSPLPILPSPVQELGAVLGLRYKLEILTTSLMSSITLALALLLLMLVLRVVLRRPWLASIVSWLLLTLLLVTTSGYAAFHLWAVSSIAAAISIALVVRGGIVALMVGLFFWSLIVNSPMTSNLSAWYAPSSMFAVLLAAALLICGFSVARTRPLIPWQRVLDD